MSSFDDKVTATHAFLLNRIALRRVTNHEELQRVIGQVLFLNGRRSNPFPVSREKIIDVLKAIDDRSMAERNVLLSALVTHFWDDGITGRFYESAIQHGLLDPEADEADRKAFHTAHLDKVYYAYSGSEVPSDLSSLFPQDEDEAADLDA